MAQVGKTPNEDGGYDNNDDDNDEDDDDDDNNNDDDDNDNEDDNGSSHKKKRRETNEKIPYPDLIILTSHFECWTVWICTVRIEIGFHKMVWLVRKGCNTFNLSIC